MIYVFALICVLLCALCDESVLLSLGVSDMHLIGCFTYETVHTSWLHLILNMVTMFLMFKPVYKLYELKVNPNVTSGLFFLICYGVASLAGVMTSGDVPTIGASGIVFCLLGMLIMLNPTLTQLRSYVYVAAALLIQVVLGHSNVALHIVAFILGALFIIISIYGAERRRLYTD